MSAKNDNAHTILVVEDVEETRDGIEALLERDGYRVRGSRDGDEAIRHARLTSPDLILISPGSPMADVIALARHIKDHANLCNDLPVVIFCVEELNEGAEITIESNIYLTHPDNFNQVRGLIDQLLQDQPHGC